MNNLDRKPFKNDFTGKSAKTKQHFKPNSNLSGYGKGTDVTVKTNKLALPVIRTGSSTGKLVKRTYTDVAPGLQGGLRETMGVLEAINNFCESTGSLTIKVYLPYQDREIAKIKELFGDEDRVIDGEYDANISDKYDSDTYFFVWNVDKETATKISQAAKQHGLKVVKRMGESSSSFNDLIVRIRHARKTGDKAKEAMAKDELERLAIRHNKMKDPEVLDALS